MSRLIVKGLPTNIDEPKLKKLFSERGTVTDCQLKYTPEGKFRKFAFIGFLNEEEANHALKYFDQTFIGSSRVTVELCLPFGDDAKPRAWSRYAKDSSAYQNKASQIAETQHTPAEKPVKKKTETQAEKMEHSLELEEFMKLNKQTVLDATESKEKKKKKKGKKKDKKETEKPGSVWNETDNDYPLIQQLGSILKSWAEEKGITDACIVRQLPVSIKGRQLRDLIAPVKPKHIRILRDVDGNCAVAMLTCNRISELNACCKKNGNFIGGNKIEMSKVVHGSVPILEEDKQIEIGESGHTFEHPALEGKEAVDAVLDTGRLFVRNLSYLTSEDDLKHLFEKFGPVSEMNLVTDKHGQSKGYAQVTMLMPEQAVQAYTSLDGSIFQGRMLHIMPGKEKPGDEKSKEVPVSEMSFKDKKAANLKMLAAKGSTWNTLFLGANSIADVLSQSLNTDKAQLLDPHSADAGSKKKSGKKGEESSVGVRMALGETQLVRETREFLLSNGVDVNVFGKKGKLGKSTLLVKNLPAKTTKQEVIDRFAQYGELGRVVLPPSGVTAIVEFMVDSDAAQAFKKQAFARFGSLPLFLEWAPENVFRSVVVDKDKMEEEQKPKLEEDGDMSLEKALEEMEEKEEDLDEPEPETSIFVKNLNFDTNDEQLREKFARIGKVVSAHVSKKKHPKEPGQLLSMGFGFVQYMRSKDAQKAIKDLQGYELDGHSLQLKLSTNQAQSTRANEKEKESGSDVKQGGCTKILVRNIPFQANSREVQDLFSAFGTVINVRMPSKMVSSTGTKSHRGFGFVQFTTKAGAKLAFDSLKHSTHLYGRRLVLEWAKTDETVDDVRKRTAHHFEAGEQKAALGKSKRLMKDALQKAAGTQQQNEEA